jgi:hypothetical protein
MMDLEPDTEATVALRQLADMHRRAVVAESEVARLRSLVAELQAPPVVPWGFEVVNRYDGVGWCLEAKVVEMGTQETAQAYRALAWAMAHNTRPPHEADRKVGEL